MLKFTENTFANHNFANTISHSYLDPYGHIYMHGHITAICVFGHFTIYCLLQGVIKDAPTLKLVVPLMTESDCHNICIINITNDI